MAITIRSRKSTEIGYRGTSGGSVSWINQAGQSGRQLASLGNTMINMADDVKKIFDDEVSQAEIRQQVDDMQVAYLKQSRSWHKDLKEGGFQLDENGVPSTELNPNYYTDISNQHHDTFWKEQVSNQDYDPKAVSAFGVYFQNKAQESFNKADKWGTERRYSKLKAKDVSNVQSHMVTITNDPSIENKNSAFDALQNMHLSGASHRNPKEWTGIMAKAQTALTKNIAITNAYGQQGRNLDPSDLINGYTVQDYSTAIERINADSTLTKDEKKAIVKGMTSNRKTRIAVEKTARATANNALHNEFSTLFRKNALTEDIVNNSKISEDKRKYWIGELNGGTNKPWKADFNNIGDRINSGTWLKDNDIARTPEDVVDLVVEEAQNKNIPYPEVSKLMKRVRDESKASPITVKKKAARTHAKSMFSTKTEDLFSMLKAGRAGGNQMAKEIDAANASKLWKYDLLIEQELEEGLKNGRTWSKMLSPNSPDYIVNDIIDSINETEPGSIPVPVEEDPSWASQFNEFVSGIFSSDETQVKVDSNGVTKVDEQGNDVVEAVGVTHEVYGSSSVYKTGVTYEQAKAQVDSQYAKETLNDVAGRIVYPEGHPGYSQFKDGVETWEHWKERKRLMGYK